MSSSADAFDLDAISVAKPCRASWADMKGDDRVRACALCQKNVYDLSGLTRPEAEALVRRSLGATDGEGLCVRFWRRADGTVLTQDCPVGLAKWKRRIAFVASGVTAALTLAAAALVGIKVLAAPGPKPLTPSRPLPEGELVVMGAICPAPPPAPPPAPVPGGDGTDGSPKDGTPGGGGSELKKFAPVELPR